MTKQLAFRSANRKPDFAARIHIGQPDIQCKFLTIGAAWQRDGGGLYIKLTGKKLVDAPIYLFPTDEPKTADQR